ncbi:MAG: hypothetical protein H8F28_10260 [Fibrella sp.]|nr:hypothetical protein [Armatimonadota bacterium]
MQAWAKESSLEVYGATGNGLEYAKTIPVEKVTITVLTLCYFMMTMNWFGSNLSVWGPFLLDESIDTIFGFLFFGVLVILGLSLKSAYAFTNLASRLFATHKKA